MARGWLLGLLLASGCAGQIRDTTTARGSTETLLLSTAIDRAVVRWPVDWMKGRRVFIDDRLLDPQVDKAYLVSALRAHAARGGARLVDARADAELVVEARCGTLGCWEGDYLLGIPTLPLSHGGTTLLTPRLTLGFSPRQGWVKLQLFVQDTATGEVVASSGDLWGAASEDLLRSVYPSKLDVLREETARSADRRAGD